MASDPLCGRAALLRIHAHSARIATSKDVPDELGRMATEYQHQAARLGEAPELGDEPPAVEVGAVNGGRAWQLNHVDNSGDQEDAGCEHQDFSNVEAGEEKHSAHGYPQSSTRHRQDCTIGTAAKM